MLKILIVSFLFLLSGCAAPIIITGVGLTGVAVQETTGKGLADHAVSTVNDQDCKIARAFNNQPVCQDANTIKLTITNTSTNPSSVAKIQSRYSQ